MRIALDWNLIRPAWHILNSVSDRWAAALAQWNRRLAIRRTRMILNDLPDSILRDIGIARADIHAIASEHFEGYRDPSARLGRIWQ